MKKLIIFALIAPMLVFANGYSPFKNVEKSGNKILITFHERGNRYSVTYKDKSFINRYGQILKINTGDKLSLIEKHTKYIVTATTKSNLHVQYIHNWQGHKTKKSYDILITEIKEINPEYRKKKEMKRRSQIFKERYKKYDELLTLFPKSPFVINNGSLVVLKNINIQNIDKQKAIINLALKSLIGIMDIPDGCKVVVQDEGKISIVTFENKLPEGSFGADYIAEIKINTKEMKMIEMLVGS